MYFAGRGGVTFEYNHDPEKTRQTFNDKGWATLWDVGHVDDEGYLYLTDRKLFMIVSGGVNIYPQEIEDVLVLHPAVADVAVFGIPEPEMGEEVKAVVQPAPGARARPRARGGDHRLLPGPPLALQVPAHGRLHRRAAPGRERQALQEGRCATPTGPARPPAPPEPPGGVRTSAYQARTRATAAPKSSTSVMPTASTTGPMSRLPDAHGPAEAHHPQRHDPAPHVLVDPGLQRGVQRGDEGEVEGARERPRRSRPAPGCAEREARRATARSRPGRPAPASAWRSRTKTVPMEMAPMRAPVPKRRRGCRSRPTWRG